jgi:malonyl-CoA O-methyltransferase
MHHLMTLQHGWGWDASIWRGWSGTKLDRGYFDRPESETAQPSVLVAHSLGLYLLDPTLFERCKLLVIIGGFQALPQRHLEQMWVRLAQHDLGVLSEFWKRCHRPSDGQRTNLANTNWELLAEDLDLGNTLPQLPPTLVIHGTADRIVPVADRFSGGTFEHIIDGGGHMLPLTHGEECRKVIDKTLSTLSVSATFSSAAHCYHMHATVPAEVAELLEARMPETLPDGPILEIGCGSGMLTEKIIKKYPSHHTTATDLSFEMLRFAERRLPRSDQLTFEIRNGEHPLPKNSYAAITSSMAVQWFTDWERVLTGYRAAIVEGGALLIAMLGSDSFLQWREACELSSVPFTGIPLPDKRDVSKCFSVESVTIETVHNHPKDFFRYLKRIGASSTEAPKLSRDQWETLFRVWTDRFPSPHVINHEILIISETQCK